MRRPARSTGDERAGASRDTRRQGTGAPAGNRLRRLILTAHSGGPWLPLTRDEIVAGVPAGSRRAKSQGDYLRACQAELAAAAPRADRAEHLIEFARVCARYASWADRSTRPTRARVCAEAGMSPSTYKVCRQWWEARGYLGTVRRGYKPSLRGPDDEPNEAAVYVLCVPICNVRPARRDCPNPLTRPLTGNASRTHSTREASPEGQETFGPRLTPRAHFRRHADVLRTGPGQTISEARASWMARAYARAGWTPADLAFAVHHHPADGRYRSSATDVTRPGAWLFWRLSRWLDNPDAAWRHYCATGQLGAYRPIPSRSQRVLAAAEANAAAAARRRAAHAAALSAATPPSTAWRQARAQLAARTLPRGTDIEHSREDPA